MRLILILVLLTFSNNTEKRAHKTLFKFYGEDIVLLKTKINVPNGALYEVAGKTDKVYIGYSPSKFDDFDYMVLFDSSNKIKLVRVLIYRENYGGEIGSKRWLKQFIGMTEPKNYVDAISGATISVNSMKYSINKLIKSL
jgi:hypothetical protein